MVFHFDSYFLDSIWVNNSATKLHPVVLSVCLVVFYLLIKNVVLVELSKLFDQLIVSFIAMYGTNMFYWCFDIFLSCVQNKNCQNKGYQNCIAVPFQYLIFGINEWPI